VSSFELVYRNKLNFY